MGENKHNYTKKGFTINIGSDGIDFKENKEVYMTEDEFNNFRHTSTYNSYPKKKNYILRYAYAFTAGMLVGFGLLLFIYSYCLV